MSWRVLLIMLLFDPTISYADSFTNCVEEVMRSTGKPQDEVARACSDTQKEARLTPDDKYNIMMLAKQAAKEEDLYRGKMAERERIIKLGASLGKSAEEINAALKIKEIENIQKPEDTLPISFDGKRYDIPASQALKYLNKDPQKIQNYASKDEVSPSAKDSTIPLNEIQKEKTNMHSSDGEAWIVYPDGTRKRIYP